MDATFILTTICGSLELNQITIDESTKKKEDIEVEKSSLPCVLDSIIEVLFS